MSFHLQKNALYVKKNVISLSWKWHICQACDFPLMAWKILSTGEWTSIHLSWKTEWVIDRVLLRRWSWSTFHRFSRFQWCFWVGEIVFFLRTLDWLTLWVILILFHDYFLFFCVDVCRFWNLINCFNLVTKSWILNCF